MTPMKLSCLPVSFYRDMIDGRMSIQEWATIARRIGLDAIDLSTLLIKNRTAAYLESLLDNLEQAGMPITMITTYPDFTHPDKLQREREFAYCMADIAVASQLHARYLRITAGQAYMNQSEDQTLDIVADYFYKVKEWADTFNIQLVFENHSKPGVWQRPDFLFDTRRFLKLARKMNKSGIGINFDTANTFAFGDDPVAVFKEILPQVETIHVSDIEAANGLKFTTIGTGAAPVAEILSIARNSGFNGWVCIEEASNTGIDGCKNAVEYVRQAWEKHETTS
jgi:sugar phosphate isomerase/epimerase